LIGEHTIPRAIANLVVLSYAIGFPLIGVILAIAASLVSWRSARKDVGLANRPPSARLAVFVELALVPLLFGAALSFLIEGRADERPPEQLEWAARAYGIPGMMTGFAFALIFFRGTGHTVRVPTDFGRTIVVATLPQTAALFAFSIGFLILGQDPSEGSADVIVDASRSAAWLMIGASLVAPVQGYAMMTFWRFEKRRWMLAILVGAAFEIPVLVGHNLAFFQLVL
jgi:F0F1-type ATP synthase membrane subunit c/vacuolar-type H+-ATPase subunit K